MYGIKGIDHLCRPGQLRRVLAGSYPSGGSKLDPPLIRELIHTDQIEALNIPSGVLFQMHRAASTGQPGVLTAVGLGTYADPRIEGAKMNAVTDDFIQLMKVNGNEYLFCPAVNVDVAIIRATTADLYGNLSYEEECSTLGALDQAYAAHNNGDIVIAQVKRLSDTQLATQAVHIPGILVDAIVLDPDQMQTTQTFYDPALSGQIHRDFDDIEPVEFGLEKVIARRAAAELQVNAAGGKDWSPLVHMPVGFTKLGGPRYNWEFSTVPQPQLNNRQMWYPQGRTLGGSTSINAMIYIRGQKEDYEAWAELGNKHWGYEQVLPFSDAPRRMSG
jgi:propionate CoA-transferase